MWKKLLNLKLPKKYEECLFEYESGLDNVPDWPTLQKSGWSFDEHIKLYKLVAIESMKYTLNSAIDDKEVTEDEIIELKKIIENAIKQYDEM